MSFVTNLSGVIIIHSYIVPHWINDRDVAFQSSDENCVGRCDEESPERGAGKPYTTNELVVDAATWHTSTIHLDNIAQQREERSTHVYDALVDDEDVYRLNKQRLNLAAFAYLHFV